ncbi:hypothetical protein [Sporomusa termitida]|uniref:Uncharacterized protein n=1 Tax=Sporomusa termitida TaxID=2377 RepID=A0A517DSY5_9FIRM|nr:hypothetical protein [Sporomusa termitida]QDR80460.1 hypothetical protein SPTER_17870 [Sporomusa termitida]
MKIIINQKGAKQLKYLVGEYCRSIFLSAEFLFAVIMLYFNQYLPATVYAGYVKETLNFLGQVSGGLLAVIFAALSITVSVNSNSILLQILQNVNSLRFRFSLALLAITFMLIIALYICSTYIAANGQFNVMSSFPLKVVIFFLAYSVVGVLLLVIETVSQIIKPLSKEKNDY